MAEPSYPLDEDCTNLGYFDSFYKSRGLQEVLTAIREFGQADH
jgi:hypothetical protein